MGLEERCGDEDMHVSTTRIPIIQEHPLDVKDGDSLEDSRIMHVVPESGKTTQNQLPRTIYAPIGDAEFWMDIHIGLLEYALHAAENSILEKDVAETRVALVQSDLYIQFTERMRLQDDLRVQKQLAENYKFVIHLAVLLTQNKIEEKDNILRMYEERFGTQEELLKLAKAEEDSKLPGIAGPRKYVNIGEIIKQHETGVRITLGDRMFLFAERLLSPKTYSDIATAVYKSFTGKIQNDDVCG
jgi:hypothetical protein